MLDILHAANNKAGYEAGIYMDSVGSIETDDCSAFTSNKMEDIALHVNSCHKLQCGV